MKVLVIWYDPRLGTCANEAECECHAWRQRVLDLPVVRRGSLEGGIRHYLVRLPNDREVWVEDHEEDGRFEFRFPKLLIARRDRKGE